MPRGSFTGRDEEGIPDELRYKSRKILCERRSLKRWLQSLGGQDQKLDSILVGPGRNNAHSLKGEGGKAPNFSIGGGGAGGRSANGTDGNNGNNGNLYIQNTE